MSDLIKRLRDADMREDLDMVQALDLCLLAADEIERLTAVIRKLNGQCDHLGIRLGEVIAERDALRADAERYRWLRERSCWTISVDASLLKLAISAPGLAEPLSRSDDELDAAIDAARKERP